MAIVQGPWASTEEPNNIGIEAVEHKVVPPWQTHEREDEEAVVRPNTPQIRLGTPWASNLPLSERRDSDDRPLSSSRPSTAQRLARIALDPMINQEGLLISSSQSKRPPSRRESAHVSVMSLLLNPALESELDQQRRGAPKDFRKENVKQIRMTQAAYRKSEQEARLQDEAELKEKLKIRSQQMAHVKSRYREGITQNKDKSDDRCPPSRGGLPNHRPPSPSVIRSRIDQKPDRTLGHNNIKKEEMENESLAPSVTKLKSLHSLSDHNSSPSVQPEKGHPALPHNHVVPTRPQSSTTPRPASSLHHTRVGELPEYLKKRKEEWRRAEEDRIASIPDPDCPPGHVLMPDNERVDTLAFLKENHEKLTLELSKMSVVSDTLKHRTRKADLENKLSDIEDAIRLFSRTKVFVKRDN